MLKILLQKIMYNKSHYILDFFRDFLYKKFFKDFPFEDMLTRCIRYSKHFLIFMVIKLKLYTYAIIKGKMLYMCVYLHVKTHTYYV